MILLRNVSLKKHSNFKIGGTADYFYEFSSKDDLLLALSEWKSINPDMSKIFVLGGGTNVLFSDEGYDGLVLKDSTSFLERKGEIVTAGGGTQLADLISFCIQNSLSGFEWAGGLPGTVGGAVRGNAGAFLGETGDCVYRVESLNYKTLKVVSRNKKQCEFSYRQSVFKKSAKDEIILSIKFKLKKGITKSIKEKTQEKIDYRIDRHPLNLPNVGSTFKNVDVKKFSKQVVKEFESSIKPDPFPVIPAAKLLAAAGLKGRTVGGAKFSEKHPNFIVNFNNAKAEDVLSLIKIAKRKIKKMFDISLEEEIMIV